MKKLILLILIFAIGELYNGLNAQVTIAPTSIFIQQQDKFGNFTVINSSDQTQEISISFLFGYPRTDQKGNVFLEYDSTSTNKFSLTTYIRAFPKNFILQPEQRQSVRIGIVNESKLNDGTYWCRIKVTSNPQNPPIEQASSNEVAARVNFKFEQIIALFYRSGNVDTDISIKKFYSNSTDSTYQFFADVKRQGNSPFHGTVSLSLSSKGNTVLEKQSSIAVYFDYLKRFDIPYSKLDDDKTYTATVTFRSQRSDISGENLIKIDPVSESTTFTVSK